jgi:hypothetical protein
MKSTDTAEAFVRDMSLYRHSDRREKIAQLRAEKIGSICGHSAAGSPVDAPHERFARFPAYPLSTSP